MTGAGLAAALIFLLVFALITTERTHKATAALVGAALVLVLGLVDQHTAFHGEPGVAAGVDWNTIFLLVGTMIIVNVTRRTGIFQWAAIRAAKLVRGQPASLLVALCVVAALLSAFLNNVTTVMLIAPVTILICDVLGTDAVPFLICTAIAANLGGAATLIGHPPNMMIGSAAGFTFLDFLRVDLPFVALDMTLFLLGAWLFLRRKLQVPEEDRLRLLALDERTALTDRPLLVRCLIVGVLTLAGFIANGRLGLQPATVALAGAALLLLLHREDPEEVLREVEWPTLVFFIGVFIMVSALVKNGVMQMLGHGLFAASHGSVPGLTLGTLWLSGGVCGVVEPVSFTAAMIPVIKSVAQSLHPAVSPAQLAVLMRTTNLQALWWALSLGSNLGANLTILAAATNVVVASIANRAGHPITFRRFLKYGVPVTLVNMVLATGYLWLRFLR